MNIKCLGFALASLFCLNALSAPITLIEKVTDPKESELCTVLKFQVSDLRDASGEVFLSLKEFGFLKGILPYHSDRLTTSNKLGNILGFNHQSVTKRNEIYLIVKNSFGDVLLLEDVNQRIAKEIPKDDGFDQTELFLNKIEGDVMTVLFIPYQTIQEREPVTYKVRILPTGQFKFVSKREGLPSELIHNKQ